ncbi:3D domain-containing protein [Candidatus Uhrbacteria bacterium]|nr:3D domain-containing protein [Candidatus Uhrbacteria bacterium]
MSQLFIKQFVNFLKEDAFFARTAIYWIFDVCKPVKKAWICAKRDTLNVSLVIFATIIGLSVFFPTIANADIEQEQIKMNSESVSLIVEAMKNETRPFGRLTLSLDAPPRRSYKIPLTAYTSEPAQTDDTPCITASGLDVCERDIENVVAANFLPIGTRVRIPELYGERVFYVEDRMNERYYYKMDIWMKQKSDAKIFGVKYATIEVF